MSILKQKLSDERGIALVVVILVMLAVATISAGAALISSNASLINRYNNDLSVLEAVANSGIEEARSRVNGDKTLYPANGYSILENQVQVTDASGNTIPGVTRSTYVGPTGVTSGQYGVFGSIVTVAEDNNGNKVVRRGEIVQESFAKFAYFTDNEGGNIWFAGGDQIFGPLHTNDQMKIHYTGATFWGPVTTAQDVYQPWYGTFAQGYTEYAPVIPMPATAELTKLQSQAAAGNTSIVGNSLGGAGRATTRIEFVAIDLDGDGQVTGANEGFFRVFQGTDARYVIADVPSDYGNRGLRNSENCGYWDGGAIGVGNFIVADDLPNNGGFTWLNAVTSATRRCYLGGDPAISGGFQPVDNYNGQYVPWTGPVSPLVAGRPDAQYLFPLSRELNPSFKGVIYVQGKVAISGVVRGQVTLAASDDIIIADDITYATDPGAGTCADILGIFSGDDVIIADNTINAPKRPRDNWGYRTYDDTGSEFIHGVILALDIFTVQNYWSGSTSAQWCENRRTGRGCIYLTGGIIQNTRGAVGLTNGAGYSKRYSYDLCAATAPPPYFPTTGHFVKGRYYEVDPVNFDVASYFAMLTP